MKKNVKKILFSVFVAISLLVVAGVTIIIHLIDINQYKPDLEKTLTESTGADWTIKGDIALSLLPSLSVTVHDIQAAYNKEELIKAGSVNIKVGLIPLLSREVHVGKFEIRDTQVNIIKDANGNLYIPVAPPAQETETSAALPIKSLIIDKIAINNGTITYLHKKADSKTALSNIDFSLGGFTIIENNKLIDNLQERIKNSKLVGNFHAKSFSANKIQINNISIKLTGNNGLFSAKPISADMQGVPLSGELAIDASSTLPKITMQCAIKGYEVGQLVKEPDKESPINGALDMNAQLNTQGKTQEELLNDLSGVFSIRGSDLTLKQIDIDAILDKYEKSRNFSLVDLGGFFVLGPLGPLLTKTYDYSNVVREVGGGESTITKIVADWQIKNGVAIAEDVAFATRENRVAIQGKINLAKSRFEQLEVAIINASGCKEFSQTINGTFDNPEMEEASFVAQTIVNPVLGLIKKTTKVFKQEECKPFYTGQVAHPVAE